MAKLHDDTDFDNDPDVDLSARYARIRERLLNSIEATLDQLQPAKRRRDPRRSAIGRILRAQLAPFVCQQATCRRAQVCRRKPCVAFPPD